MNNSTFRWKTWVIASAMLLLLFIGGFLISGKQPVQSQQPAQVDKVPAIKAAGSSSSGVDKVVSNNDLAVTIAKPKSNPHKKPTEKIPAKPVDTNTTPSPASTAEDAQATPLDEMVVMGIAAPGNEAMGSSGDAHPKNGWGSFESYLKEKAVSPDAATGIVQIAFTVTNDGTCSAFKIKSGLTAAADQKAIELVKNGPQWTGNTDGQAKEITVSVKFH